MRDDDLVVTGLVTRAKDGDQQAWDAIVERYAPLIWAICRSYRLARADTDDVAQTVWLQLLTHLGTLRNPAALGLIPQPFRRTWIPALSCNRSRYLTRLLCRGAQVYEVDPL